MGYEAGRVPTLIFETCIPFPLRRSWNEQSLSAHGCGVRSRGGQRGSAYPQNERANNPPPTKSPCCQGGKRSFEDDTLSRAKRGHLPRRAGICGRRQPTRRNIGADNSKCAGRMSSCNRTARVPAMEVLLAVLPLPGTRSGKGAHDGYAIHIALTSNETRALSAAFSTPPRQPAQTPSNLALIGIQARKTGS